MDSYIKTNKTLRLSRLLTLVLLCAPMAACMTSGATSQNATLNKSNVSVIDGSPQDDIDFTGGISEMDMTSIQPSDPRVAIYGLDGVAGNPLNVDRSRSVLDNTTAGGYTVFDESVTVYPLPGETSPAYLPSYAVPPLEGQYRPQAPMLGAPMGLAGRSVLPPLPTMNVPEADPYASPPVSGAVKVPMALNAPQPLTLQPPSLEKPDYESPFLTQGTSSGAIVSTATGRKSGPVLTGY